MKIIKEQSVLADLKIGQKAKILKLNESNKRIRRHLLDMGITRGAIVIIKQIAPLDDPINIKLRDYELCISKGYLRKIEVEVIE